MTLRKFAIALAVITAAAGIVACNSSSYEDTEIILSSGTGVKTFSLEKNDSVMANLDSVFFSIDLVAGKIFNADSLPFGTKVTALVPKITLMNGATAVELKVKRENNTDTVYNYLEDSSEAIDFTNPVTLHITSANGKSERNYTISVNVHKVKSDSLTWDEQARTTLPTAFAAPTAQRTVRKGDNFYCLTTQGNACEMGIHSGDIAGMNGALPSKADWQIKKVTFPFEPQINSLAASDDALYILANDGTLWTSADEGASWTSTSLKWHYIYGGYQTSILGSVQTEDGWRIQAYPSGKLMTMPDGMPVSNTSVPVHYSFPMSDNPQALFVGGRKADGSLSADTWGFDGNSWAKVSKRALAVPLEDVAIVSYVTFAESTGLSFQEYPSIVAFGGRDASGKPSAVVYASNDYGFNWSKAGDMMQLPEALGAFSNAQAYVMTSTYTAQLARPRIIKPIESWDCPFVYLFGGINASGELNNCVWRGVINRLTFKPIE